MRNPFKKNKEVRTQGSLIPMNETATKGNYISNVIKKKYYDFYKIEHRVAVCKMDAIAKRLTYVWGKVATAKTFKFYNSHEIDAVEVMQDIRAKWVELNCNEIFKKTITPMVRDGYVLLELMKKEDSIDYNVYGEYESPPQLWLRDNDGKIVMYGIQFTPKPRAMGSSLFMLGISPNISNLAPINKKIAAKDIIHCEYGEPNYGCGMPLIEGAWDSIIKLAGESHQEMMDRRAIPTLHLTEDEYDAQDTKAKGMLKMVANSDQDTARVWYHKKSTHGEILDYPQFAYESPTTNKQYSQRNQTQGISTGDFGNVSKEWTRLTTVTGHSINYFMGNRAGAVTGSETDKLNDDEQEIIDFGLLEVIIRKILDWLDAQGLITLPKKSFVIKYWKDWERIELKKENEKKMKPLLENPTQPGPDKQLEIDKQDNKSKEEKKNRHNELIEKNVTILNELVNCVHSNMSYIMTPVVSHWISEIGYYDKNDRLYMRLLDGKVYSKPAPMGEWSYLDWKDASSIGGYFWDYLSQRDPPWQIDTIPYEILWIGDLFSQNNELVKIPVLDYPLINSLDTESKIKKLGQKTGWSMGTTTATSIKKMLGSLKENANKHQLRINTMTAEAFGNSIKENHPLLYDIGDGTIVEEYICPDSWKKLVNTTVPLGVYHNLEQDNTPELPEWQIVGNAEIFGWDDELGEDYVKYDYDYDKIKGVFDKLNQFDWLTSVLKENGTSDISTAYYADIEIRWNDKMQKFIRVQTNIDLISISFVPRGNCPGEICSLQVIKQNSKTLQEWIKCCIEEHVKGDGTMTKAQCIAAAYKKFRGKA